VLSLIGQHGVLDTHQVTALMFGSRPTAARHLSMLVKAGLLWRFVDDRDPTHAARYEISADGTRLLERRLRQIGEPVPIGLGRRGRTDGDQLAVNAFFVRLAAYGRVSGHGHLYRWRHALDTAAWLRSQGIEDIGARGFGTWIEDGVVISFLLHLDDEPPSSLSHSLSGYRRAERRVPVDVALVVTTSDQRERSLRMNAERIGLPLPIGVTTVARLGKSASPADEIWSVNGADSLVRLVDLREAGTHEIPTDDTAES
jgi:hypothetical protein